MGLYGEERGVFDVKCKSKDVCVGDI